MDNEADVWLCPTEMSNLRNWSCSLYIYICQNAKLRIPFFMLYNVKCYVTNIFMIPTTTFFIHMSIFFVIYFTVLYEPSCNEDAPNNIPHDFVHYIFSPIISDFFGICFPKKVFYVTLSFTLPEKKIVHENTKGFEIMF